MLKNVVETSPVPEPAMIDVKIVAAMLGCSTRHVNRLEDDGRMPPGVKLGRLVKWNRKVIQEWIDAGCPSVRRHGATD